MACCSAPERGLTDASRVNAAVVPRQEQQAFIPIDKIAELRIANP